MKEQIKAAESLWEFALALYSSPGVEETALKLQDEYGADVVILLWACWLESRGQKLESATLHNAARATADWTALAVLPLRELRRSLKPAAGGKDLVGEVRARIKEAELLAERHSLALLSKVEGVPAHDLRPTANAQFYLESLGAGKVGETALELLRSAMRQI
ncbi:TIGR02444 family protein [Gilvimarinus sp. F26214L]|uniref:TIGR02444 family protein n=1 Tax=Gilvimarinus sp. DZF01 TaxID=3461371 RepID=UPI0040466317